MQTEEVRSGAEGERTTTRVLFSARADSTKTVRGREMIRIFISVGIPIKVIIDYSSYYLLLLLLVRLTGAAAGGGSESHRRLAIQRKALHTPYTVRHHQN